MKTILASLLACVLALCGLARAQQDETHASATIYAVQEGSDVKLAVLVEIDEGWHLYHGPTEADIGEKGAVGQPTTVEISGAGFAWGDWRWSEPETKTQDFGDGPVKVYEHVEQLRLWLRGVAEPGAKLEDLRVQVKGLTCENGDGGVCTPYDETKSVEGAGVESLWKQFPPDLTATKAPPKPAEAAASTATSTAAAATTDYGSGETEGQGLWAFLLSAVLWGLFTLLMPCTYPMIPITISFFTKQAAGGKGSTLPLSLVYGAGIVLIFVLIGVVVGPVIIAFATHPATNLVIGGMFLVFALTLFGVMNLNPPAWMMNAAGAASSRGGYLGVFFMGATLVITSFTCTAPFVGTLLSTGASQGGVGRIALGMGVFGLTIALPFMALSMVPEKVKALPKGGEWMKTLKVFLGFVEVAAALKFLSNADLVWGWGWLSRELFLFLWTGIFLVAMAYLFGWVRMKDEYGSEDEATVSPKRMVGGFATGLFAMYCLYGGLGHSVDPVMTAIIPNYSSKIGGGEGPAEQIGHAIIKDDFEAAVARAKQEGKLVLVNFTGFT